MAVLAEPSIEVPGDRLARRNALVLAVAQGLAGGNNIVIVSTAAIIAGTFGGRPGARHRSGLEPDRRHVGRHAACRVPVEEFRPPHRLPGGGVLRRARRADARGRGVARLVRIAVPRRRLRRLLCGGPSATASPPRTPRAGGVQAQGDLLGAGGRPVRRAVRVAARHRHQGHLAAIPVRRELSRPGGHRGGRCRAC